MMSVVITISLSPTLGALSAPVKPLGSMLGVPMAGVFALTVLGALVSSSV